MTKPLKRVRFFFDSPEPTEPCPVWQGFSDGQYNMAGAEVYVTIPTAIAWRDRWRADGAPMDESAEDVLAFGDTYPGLFGDYQSARVAPDGVTPLVLLSGYVFTIIAEFDRFAGRLFDVNLPDGRKIQRPFGAWRRLTPPDPREEPYGFEWDRDTIPYTEPVPDPLATAREIVRASQVLDNEIGLPREVLDAVESKRASLTARKPESVPDDDHVGGPDVGFSDEADETYDPGQDDGLETHPGINAPESVPDPADDPDILDAESVEAVGLDGTGRSGDPRFPFHERDLTPDEKERLAQYRLDPEGWMSDLAIIRHGHDPAPPTGEHTFRVDVTFLARVPGHIDRLDIDQAIRARLDEFYPDDSYPTVPSILGVNVQTDNS